MELESLIIHQTPRDIEKILTSRGVGGGDFKRTREKIDVLTRLSKYETNIPGVMSKTVARARQQKSLARIVNRPTSGNYVACIASFPSDAAAKHLAIHIMELAYKAWKAKHEAGRTMPLWHPVFGGLSDTLRDKPLAELPSLLVISNVNDASSNYKFEKVRDLLERYSTVPRIVVAGTNDPLTFFATKLFYPVHAGILVGPANQIKEC